MNYDKTTPLGAIAQPDNMRTLLDAGAAIGKPHKNPDQDGMHYAVVPEGYALHELPMAALPERPAATVKLRDAASFIRYFNDHKVARSRIYASLEPASFLAVFDDFDTAGGSLAQSDSEHMVSTQADWRGFRAQFVLPASREWGIWTSANRKHMSQLAFAEFLQDNLPDVADPDGATLLEMALNFEAAQTGSFVAAQRLQDGSHNLQWKADNNSSGSVKLPEFITLQLPVFENEALAELKARLRYRVAEGRLAIWYELVRPHKVLEAAFRAIWARVEKDTASVLLLGSPE